MMTLTRSAATFALAAALSSLWALALDPPRAQTAEAASEEPSDEAASDAATSDEAEGDAGPEPQAAAAAPFELGGDDSVVTYVLVDGVGAPDPLTRAPGDPRRGAEVFSDPEQGGCAGCHAVAGRSDATQIGPSLAGVGGRLSRSALRLWIIDPRFFNPEANMPAYYSVYDGEAEEPTRPRPRLGPQQIEDLVAYLDGLKPIGAAIGGIGDGG